MATRDDERRLPLFVYGTLLDPRVSELLLGPTVERRTPGTVRGRWADAGELVAATFDDTGEVIEGEVLWLQSESYEEALRTLDEYETADLYRRVRVSVLADRQPLDAYAYEWNK